MKKIADEGNNETLDHYKIIINPETDNQKDALTSNSVAENFIDYLLWLQHITANPKISKIVEIGFGDYRLTSQIKLTVSQQYIGYDVDESLRQPDTENRQFKIIKNMFGF